MCRKWVNAEKQDELKYFEFGSRKSKTIMKIAHYEQIITPEVGKPAAGYGWYDVADSGK